MWNCATHIIKKNYTNNNNKLKIYVFSLIFYKNLYKFIEFIILLHIKLALCKKTNNNVIYLLKI